MQDQVGLTSENTFQRETLLIIIGSYEMCDELKNQHIQGIKLTGKEGASFDVSTPVISKWQRQSKEAISHYLNLAFCIL